MERIVVKITADHLAAAERLVPHNGIARTKVSAVDTLGGILGELVFAEWLTGDWRNHEVGSNKGRADLMGLLEVKTSVYPYSERLNLVIREDYGAKFKPVYVQLIVDIPDKANKAITAGLPVIICGFATHAEAVSRPPRALPMGQGRETPFKVFTTPITRLRPMAEFRRFLQQLADETNC